MPDFFMTIVIHVSNITRRWAAANRSCISIHVT